MPEARALLLGMKRITLAAALGAAALAISGCSTATDTTTTGGSVEDSTSSSPAAQSGPKYTPAQENAIRSAKDYLSMGNGFSRAGLIEQLSSGAGDGFKRKDAVFAVNHITVNWNQQAVLAAKGYMSMSGFSRQGLIEQLSSKAGDKFTPAQAAYAANKVGLK